MICLNCQREIPDFSNYCSTCGARQQGVTGGKRLMRTSANAKIAGVCGGIAEYLNADATVVRLVWAILALIPGCVFGGIVAYVLAWIIVPKAPLALPAAPMSNNPMASTPKPA
jgi:phage shock protein C